jgi:hypothetical protein
MFTVGCDSNRFVGLLPGQIANPMLHAELFLRLRFAACSRHFLYHRFFFGAERKWLGIIVDRDLITVFRHERVERFDQMPRRTVHHRLQRRMNVLGWTASPFFATRYQLKLDYAFRAEVHRDDAVKILCR